MTVHHIATAVLYMKRLGMSFRFASVVKFKEQLSSEDRAEFESDLQKDAAEIMAQKWHTRYEQFLKYGSEVNGTFCLHVDMMLKCENVVAVSFSERLGGPQGYNLLLATLKTSLCSTFLDGGVSYGPFTVQLIGVHLECGPFYQKLKCCLFSTPRPGSTVNFSGDTKRELDNKDAVKCFHSGSTLDSVMRKMSLMDSFSHIHSTFKCGSGLSVDEVDHLGWKTILQTGSMLYQPCL